MTYGQLKHYVAQLQIGGYDVDAATWWRCSGKWRFHS